jgi:hypothetical protein
MEGRRGEADGCSVDSGAGESRDVLAGAEMKWSSLDAPYQVAPQRLDKEHTAGD